MAELDRLGELPLERTRFHHPALNEGAGIVRCIVRSRGRGADIEAIAGVGATDVLAAHGDAHSLIGRPEPQRRASAVVGRRVHLRRASVKVGEPLGLGVLCVGVGPAGGLGAGWRGKQAGDALCGTSERGIVVNRHGRSSQCRAAPAGSAFKARLMVTDRRSTSPRASIRWRRK